MIRVFYTIFYTDIPVIKLSLQSPDNHWIYNIQNLIYRFTEQLPNYFRFFLCSKDRSNEWFTKFQLHTSNAKSKHKQHYLSYLNIAKIVLNSLCKVVECHYCTSMHRRLRLSFSIVDYVEPRKLKNVLLLMWFTTMTPTVTKWELIMTLKKWLKKIALRGR